MVSRLISRRLPRNGSPGARRYLLAPLQAIVMSFLALAISADVGRAAGVGRAGPYIGIVGTASNFSVDVVQTRLVGGAVQDLGSEDNLSFGAGIIAGYQIPIAGPWVVGVEGDWIFNELSTSFAGGFNQPAGTSDKYQLAHWGTVRARLGYTLSSMFMLSATAGIAIIDFDYDDLDTVFSAKGSEHALGWVVGAGIDASLTENLRLRVDALQVINKSWDFNGDSVSHDVSTGIQLLRAGVIWAF